ncbi:hypothetical protein K443DRAFT_680116 [Laccaria amethystina LaAM-08-1]|uniref:Unplaced genomic scaffold K443scaffold_115, whole genome shotgun sequence n=1 Tax=Laccaria amethystina LaAM-08-1 TaxID=1095629 RepID=A0A0C9X2I7_9AGAR|nr:hypothetical protein K443DRAFT_680116 [Laccaria amethystina LaAM-08-1]
MEHPKALLFVIIALASCLGLAYPISTTDCMTAYATWGTGKYTIDLSIYHKEVKPIFLAEFKKIDKFEAYCGSNPDFEITRKGDVNPSAVEKKKKELGKCTKNNFTLDLGQVVLDHIPKQVESDDESESSLTAFGTWGVGKYTIDLGIYHKEVKPIFLTKFGEIPKFEAFCGRNPDFEIDRKGMVNPSAVEKAKISLGKCVKKTFSLDLGQVVLEHIPPPDSPDDGSEGGGSDDEGDDGSDSSLSTFEDDDDGDSEPKLLPSGLRVLPIVFSAWFEGTYASGIMASVLS